MIRAIAALLFIWIGLLVGVSLVATPAKYLAPSLPIAQALDVGRWTFHLLAWVEWGMAAAVAAWLIAAWRSGSGTSIGLVAGLIAASVVVLAAEMFAIRPLLDARVVRIMAGEVVPPSAWHNVYIALEVLRLSLLLAAGAAMLRRLGPPQAARAVGLQQAAW
jgi:sorbitol-specific phosphotransferase system component IIC